MNPKLADLTLQFLLRVDCKGSEAPAMAACIQALQTAANPQAVAGAVPGMAPPPSDSPRTQ
jgi:hypothetical protein